MRIIISIFGFCLFISVRANALPGEPGDALTIFGPRPVYSNGAKPSVVFDDFGWFDSYIPQNRKKQISAWIDGRKLEKLLRPTMVLTMNPKNCNFWVILAGQWISWDIWRVQYASSF